MYSTNWYQTLPIHQEVVEQNTKDFEYMSFTGNARSFKNTATIKRMCFGDPVIVPY